MDWIQQQESSDIEDSDNAITKEQAVPAVVESITPNIETVGVSGTGGTTAVHHNIGSRIPVENGDERPNPDQSLNIHVNDTTTKEPNNSIAAAVVEEPGNVNTTSSSKNQRHPNDDTVNDSVPPEPSHLTTTTTTTTIEAHLNNADDSHDLDTALNSTMGGAAFTSDTAATLSQKMNRIGSSCYSHMSHNNNPQQSGSAIQLQTIYGRPVHVNDSNGSFPNVASVLGPYFCLGQLGKGTFSSIHKCIDMQYYHHHHHHHTAGTTGSSTKSNSTSASEWMHQRHPVVAAKVELGSFQQSGVLEAEATMLDYLYRHVQPLGTVPKYVGHYRSDKFAAILMEFLPGEDMYQIRERVMCINNKNNNSSSNNISNNISKSATATVDPNANVTRRISIDDAVYLTADVMLPLLRGIHAVGVVHRDVKPSNCVRKNEMNGCKDFCMVDFGLSKSIIVAEDSDNADTEHPWIEGYPWMRPLNYSGTKAYYRQQRTKADFRGTSMYASLRVHQGKDYCARDDMWSLMYVFCDLVSGGLPWMSMAANRDRNACQKIKEWIHGEGSGDNDDGSPKEQHMDELLKGDLYHIAKYKRDRQKVAKVENEQLSAVPEPLRLSSDQRMIAVLQKIFQHLAGLEFWDMPDYDMIQREIRYFKETPTLSDPEIPSIDWSVKRGTNTTEHRARNWWSSTSNVPEWILLEDENNRLDVNIFDDIELPSPSRSGRDDYRKRLPIELQFHLAQMDYNLVTARNGSVPLHRALHDWMRVALPLLHHEWNSRAFEDGGHRTTTDGFKRSCYLELLRHCVTYANAFDNFQSRDCFYENDSIDSDQNVKSEMGEPPRAMKRRKVVVQCGTTRLTHADLLFVSKTLFGLEHAIRVETSKKTPPPVRISFG